MNKEPFEILHDLSRAVAKASKLEEIYEIILREIVTVMDVERASIMRFDPKKGVLRIVAAKGIDAEVWKNLEIAVGEGVSGRVWKECKPLLIKKIRGNPRYKSHSYIISPVTAFPMRVGEVPIGLINVTDKRSGEPFTNADMKLLTTISDQAASYMHLYDLVDQLKEASQAKLQLEVARQMQQRLLPQQPPAFPGLEMAGQLLTAERVGADYYDFLTSGDDPLGLCVADVSGHSVGGALLASSVRSCLRTEVQRGRSPCEIVQAINKTLSPDLFRSEQFISLFFGKYFPEEKTLSYTNAGHNPPLLLRARDKMIEWLTTQDSLLGIEENLEFHEKKVTLQKGDLLILYTDGLTEAQNPRGERFGAQRLLEAAQQGSQKSPSEVLSFLLAVWDEFTAARPPSDDVTLVVVKAV